MYKPTQRPFEATAGDWIGIRHMEFRSDQGNCTLVGCTKIPARRWNLPCTCKFVPVHCWWGSPWKSGRPTFVHRQKTRTEFQCGCKLFVMSHIQKQDSHVKWVACGVVGRIKSCQIPATLHFIWKQASQIKYQKTCFIDFVLLLRTLATASQGFFSIGFRHGNVFCAIFISLSLEVGWPGFKNTCAKLLCLQTDLLAVWLFSFYHIIYLCFDVFVEIIHSSPGCCAIFLAAECCRLFTLFQLLAYLRQFVQEYLFKNFSR